MKVIIAGGRDIFDYSIVEKAIEKSGFTITKLVCGMAPGIDEVGYKWALKHIGRDNIIECPANWKEYGNSAGPLRNAQMAQIAEALIAVWNGKSHGTKNMIDTATRLKLEVYIHRI